MHRGAELWKPGPRHTGALPFFCEKKQKMESTGRPAPANHWEPDSGRCHQCCMAVDRRDNPASSGPGGKERWCISGRGRDRRGGSEACDSSAQCWTSQSRLYTPVNWPGSLSKSPQDRGSHRRDQNTGPWLMPPKVPQLVWCSPADDQEIQRKSINTGKMILKKETWAEHCNPALSCVRPHQSRDIFSHNTG